MPIIAGKDREFYKKVKIDFGLKRFSHGRGVYYPSEGRYIAQMQAQVEALTKDLMSFIDQIEDFSPEIIKDALMPTFTKAKVYTPKLTHALVNSGYLEIVSFKAKPRVEMGFARGGEPYYAVYVHEMVGFQHAAPTRSKFLEAAVMEDLDQIWTLLRRYYWESFFG